MNKGFILSKSILLGLALIVGFGLSGCSQESELDKAAKVAIKTIEAVVNNDAQTFISLTYMSDVPASQIPMIEQKLISIVAEGSKAAKKEADAKGGFNKFEVISQEFAKNEDGSENQSEAVIKLSSKFKDGFSNEETLNLIKTSDGKWYLFLK